VRGPPLCGGRPPAALGRVRGWETHLPARRLGVVPTRAGRKRLRRVGWEGLRPLGRHTARTSAATRRRWPWTGGADDAVGNTYGEQWGRVGPWWRGQAHRVLSGMAGVLLVVVLGEGQVVVPVDGALRRPHPQGPGGPCRATRHGVQSMRDGRVAACRRRGVERPPPMVGAESWWSDAQRMRHGAALHDGTLRVEGQSPDGVALTDGRPVQGEDWQPPRAWPWRDSPQLPGGRSVRRRATRPTSGTGTVSMVEEPGKEHCDVMCLDTALRGPRLIRAWTRRRWMADGVRTLKHVWATGACQVHSEAAYYGHLGLRLMGCFVLFYPSRVICKGRMTMEEILCSLKHYWRFVDSEALERKALSQGVGEKAA